MSLLIRSKRVLLFDSAGYLDRLKGLFGSSLIGYWPMDEPSGSVAIDYSGRGFHGAYTAVTLGQPGIGDGRMSALYDGATSFMQPPAGFRSALNGQSISVLVWFAASGWTVSGDLVQLFVDVSNLLRISQNSAGATDRMEFLYTAGGTSKSVAESSGQTSTSFRHFAVTISKADDQMIVYRNGTQLGNTQTGLGAFSAGAFVANQTLIGARITTPTNAIAGLVAHVCVLNRAATAAEVAAAAAI